MKFIKIIVMLITVFSFAACSTSKTSTEDDTSVDKDKKQHERLHGRFER